MKTCNIGNFCKYNNEFGIVIGLKDDIALFFSLNKRAIYEPNIKDISLADPNDCFHSTTIKSKWYNQKINNAYSTYRSRFSKNEDAEFIFEDGSKLWFTSDTHFWHNNILKFCRPKFQTVEEMNEEIIKQWNARVKEDDIVFHLGDFCWGNSTQWEEILKRLNGHIHLILGNHDVKNLNERSMSYFDSVSFQRQIVIEGRPVYLNHYPFLTYGGIYRKEEDIVWQLFGHVHSHDRFTGGADTARLKYLLPYQMDVGVDSKENYAPYSWEEVKSYMLALSNIESPEKEIENIEHLKLKNNILMNLLTPEQKEVFDELTIDKK